MAITTTTISKNAGWAKTYLIYQLEEAFTWLGFHGPQISGIVTGISAYNGGGTVGSSSTDFHEVFAATTSGIGTGASFYVQRSSGSILYVQVNRPGVGYTNGEYVTLSADDIGGSANGATGIGLTVLVAGGASLSVMDQLLHFLIVKLVEHILGVWLDIKLTQIKNLALLIEEFRQTAQQVYHLVPDLVFILGIQQIMLIEEICITIVWQELGILMFSITQAIRITR